MLGSNYNTQVHLTLMRSALAENCSATYTNRVNNRAEIKIEKNQSTLVCFMNNVRAASFYSARVSA